MDDAAPLATVSDDQLRDEVAAWLKANWDPSIVTSAQGGRGEAYRTWIAKVVEARWAAPRLASRCSWRPVLESSPSAARSRVSRRPPPCCG